MVGVSTETYCLEVTPNEIFNNNEGIYEAGEAAISNARRALDDSNAHRGEMARYLLENFDSDKDPDVEVVVFAKNEIMRTRLNEKERANASERQLKLELEKMSEKMRLHKTNGHGKIGVETGPS